jgi:hypothetical protein
VTLLDPEALELLDLRGALELLDLRGALDVLDFRRVGFCWISSPRVPSTDYKLTSHVGFLTFYPCQAAISTLLASVRSRR